MYGSGYRKWWEPQRPRLTFKQIANWIEKNL